MMAASDIAEGTGAGSTNTSFHLKELRRTSLLRATREGRYIRYAVDPEGIRTLLAYLTRHCWQGDGDDFASSPGPRFAAKPRRR